MFRHSENGNYIVDVPQTLTVNPRASEKFTTKALTLPPILKLRAGWLANLAQRVASGEAVEDKAGKHKPPRDGVKPNQLLIHQM